MSIQPSPFQLPPGVFSVPTKSSKSLNWAETNLMRWVQSRMQPIGGWSKLGLSPFASPLMEVHRWVTNAGVAMTGYLCSGHLYVDDGSGLTDVSPLVPIVTPSDASVAGGYGDNVYSFGTYGTPRPDRDPSLSVPVVFKLDNWGEDLLAMSSADGRLLRWSVAGGLVNEAEVVPNAPTGCRTFAVTPTRHVIVWHPNGVYNEVAWCDEEDIEDWTPGVASKAGSLPFQPSSPVVAVGSSGDEILFFSANNIPWRVRYIGMPYIFSVERFAADAVPLSPRSIVDVPTGAIWASADGFWMYSSGSVLPLPCTVWDWVDSHIDEATAKYTSCFVTVPTFSEVYFFFPSDASPDNNRYVVFNYKDGWWGTGKMSRRCGSPSTYNGLPLMSDGVSVFQHESGSAYSLLPGEELPWARTHNINVEDGFILHTLGRMLPDMGGDYSDVVFQVNYGMERTGPRSSIDSSEYPMRDGVVGFRETARDSRIIVKQTTTNVRDWTMGNTLLEIIPRGRA